MNTSSSNTAPSLRPLTVGTAVEAVGQIVRGSVDLIKFPTGQIAQLPVVIASGTAPAWQAPAGWSHGHAPTMLLTCNIHGDEVTGLIVVHRLLDEIQKRGLDSLYGRLVCFPSLNPTGLLLHTRYPMFENQDPNRRWPDAKPEKKDDPKQDGDWLDSYYSRQKKTSAITERIWERIFALWKDDVQPDFHVDLHTFSQLSVPFIFLDRVLYGGAAERPQAEKLFQKTRSMVEMMGLSVLMERPARTYVDRELHRSTSGATLNKLRIPSCTVELGPMRCVSPAARDSGLKAVRNAIVWAGMLPSTAREDIFEVPVYRPLSGSVRYLAYPTAPCAGIADFVVDVGSKFVRGQVLVVMRALDGSKLCEIRAGDGIDGEFDEGFLMAWDDDVAKFEGETLGLVALPDRMPAVVSWDSIQ